mgnify:CR=1 FL=1
MIAPTSKPRTNILEVRNLRVAFDTPGGAIHALRGIDFRITERETVALVGESGSGKSVTAQVLMGLLPKVARISSGEALFRDPKTGTVTDLARLSPATAEFRAIRGGRISIVFQEPMTSMSPLHRVGAQIQEALELHDNVTGAAAKYTLNGNRYVFCAVRGLIV